MITCPKCGRLTPEGAFCSRCGAELAPVAPSAPPVAAAAYDPDDEPTLPSAARPEFHRSELQSRIVMNEGIRTAEERIQRSTAEEEMLSKQRGEPMLEVDRLCPLFENLNSTLRFRFNPRGGGDPVENVIITFSNCDCAKKPVQRIRRANQIQEFPVQFPPQGAGMQSWNVTVEYVSARRKHELTGDFQVIVKPVESRKRGSDNFNIKIETNIGDVSQASDVTVNQRGAEGLAGLIAATDPFEEMSRVYMSDKRQWTLIPFSDDNKVVDLPPMPANAQSEHIVLDVGSKRFHFFANRTIKFGRKKEMNDIALRPAPGANEMELLPYRKVSREHCFFEHSGTKVLLADGGRNPLGVIQPSSGGTFWNNEQVRSPIELPVGTTGIVSFGGIHYGDNLSLDLKVCEPAKACSTCPHANIRWCGEGQRPSLMLSRRDGLPEKFVGLWSCFWLGEADPSFDGVIIFRKDGAFAYRRDDGRSGWLVPGTTIQTDFGMASIN